MKIELTKTTKAPPKDAALVFVAKEKEKIEKHPFFELLTKGDRDYLSAFVRKSPLKAERSSRMLLPSGLEVLLLGVSEKSKWNHRKAILAARRAVSYARSERVGRIALSLNDFSSLKSPSPEELAEILAAQLELANFEFVQYKTPPPEGWSFIKEILVYASGPAAKIALGLKNGQIIGEEVNQTRVLSNTPGGDMTPAKLAEAAVKAGKRHGFKIKVLGEKEIKKLKMGGVLGVSRGSSERPRFIVMEYLRGAKNEKPVVLVGKGVTFDTGGLNIKGGEHMYEMHMDMSGGAAVIHVLAALARLKIKKNVIGLVPAVENMPSGSSYHPGDLLKTMSGKTVEVLNTDAEGRVILADALEYAKRYKPRLTVDVATLTGAAMVALGQRASAIFVTDPKLERTFRETGERVGDFVWPLPLWEDYEEEVKGTFGDVANVGKTKYGGAITGAVFLWQFTKDPSTSSGQAYPWVHIDIAPRMTSIEGEFLAKGSAGPAVALLTHFLREF